MAKTLIVCAALILLAACSPRPHIETSAVAFWCATNTPEQPTVAQYASYTLAQKQRMDGHNSYGAEHCGWRP